LLNYNIHLNYFKYIYSLRSGYYYSKQLCISPLTTMSSYLVINHISKKGNVRDLCASALAHCFDVIIVGGFSTEGKIKDKELYILRYYASDIAIIIIF
jgi:hypothetical protein